MKEGDAHEECRDYGWHQAGRFVTRPDEMRGVESEAEHVIKVVCDKCGKEISEGSGYVTFKAPVAANADFNEIHSAEIHVCRDHSLAAIGNSLMEYKLELAKQINDVIKKRPFRL